MKLTIRPLTPDLWPALADLFGKRGASNGCWCMYGRIGSAYRMRPGEKNKADFRAIVERGPPPGLIAFDRDLAVGWCQLTPRDAVPALDRVWRLKRVDDVRVWSLSCLYVRIGYRRRGVTAQLIAAALKAAKRAKAPALEAYPFDAQLSPSASGCGYASTFARAGFKIVARRTPARPIMRHDLKRIAPRGWIQGVNMATGQDLRRIALSLEGTTEAPHFDRAAFKVARIYVTLAADGRSANFKFTPDEQEFKCMMAPEAFAAIPNAWGRQGWTTATLSKLSTAELKAALEMAWAHAVEKKKAKRR